MAQGSRNATDAPLLSVKGLKVFFRLGKRTSRAVEGVDFSVKRGETVCLVGESGCGKTLSALAVLGLVPRPPGEIAGGEILFDGKDLLGLGEAALREIRGDRIAMVFQEPLTSLNPVFTVGDQIGEALTLHTPLRGEAVTKRTIALLRDTGIPSPETRLRDYPHQMSGGQRQRVMIAMALACDPDLLIADEPTTALDVTIQAQILGLLKGLQAERGLSVLYITHDLGVVAGVADRVYVMYAGCIVEEGTPTQIFHGTAHPYTRGLLASLPSRNRRGERLKAIAGTVPDPRAKPAGCPFHPRCPLALPRCRERFPEMCGYGGGHRARCPVLFEGPHPERGPKNP